MSLGKRYYVTCERNVLLWRLGHEWLSRELFDACYQAAPEADTSTTARRNAKTIGWTRPQVRVHLTGDQSTMQRFDLCPSCSVRITEKIGELPH